MRPHRQKPPSAHPAPPWRSSAGWGKLHLLARTLAVLLWAVFESAALAQGALDPAEEYRLKAVFLFNFAAFTHWPENDSVSLWVCVYGDTPLGAHVDAIAGRKVGKRNLQVQILSSVDALDGCDVVFIARRLIGNLPRVLDRLDGRAVLTVADSPGAMRNGVMLNMDSSTGRISFSANLAAARQQGLELSSKLLKLATEVRQ